MTKQDPTTGKNISSLDNVHWYYLHANGSLIHKPNIVVDIQGFEESPFVVQYWKVDITNRMDLYLLLIRATLLNANKPRIDELKKQWGVTEEDTTVFCQRAKLMYRKENDNYKVLGVGAPDDLTGEGPNLFDACVSFFRKALKSALVQQVNDKLPRG
jgi:hypothetical protein